MNFPLNRLVPVSLSYCAPTIRGRGAGWAGAVQLGGLVHEAHNIMGSYLTTTKAQLFKLSIEYSEIEL